MDGHLKYTLGGERKVRRRKEGLEEKGRFVGERKVVRRKKG